MNAIQLLTRDHRLIVDLFRRYGRARGNEQKARIVRSLKQELDSHAAVEEEVLYPAVRESRRGAGPTVAEAYEDHHLAKTVLRELASSKPGGDEYDAKVVVLRRLVETHIASEEGRGGIFAKASALGQARLLEVGEEIAARKRSLRKGVQGVMTAAAEATQGLIERQQRVMDRATSLARTAARGVTRTVGGSGGGNGRRQGARTRTAPRTARRATRRPASARGRGRKR